jgi:hypothetical protein
LAESGDRRKRSVEVVERRQSDVLALDPISQVEFMISEAGMVKFACDCCGRSYSVAEELRGRAFKMKCKLCGHLIVVKPSAAPLFPETATRSTGSIDEHHVAQPGAVPLHELTPVESIPIAFPQPGSRAPSEALPPFPSLTKSSESRPPPPHPSTSITDRAPSQAATHDSPETAAAAPPPLPAPEVPSPDRDSPAPGGYLDFLLDEKLGPPSPVPPAHLEEITGERKAPETVPVPSSTPPATAASPEEQKDPFAGWLADEDQVEAVPADESASVEAEITAPTAPPRKAPSAPAPAPALKSAPTPKKGGKPKTLVLFAAGAVVIAVAAGAWWMSSSSKPAVKEPTIILVPGGPLSPIPAAPRPQMEAPQLAPPDPQYTSGDKTGPKAAPAPASAPGGQQPRPEGAAERPANRPNGTKQAQIIAAQRQAFDECTSQAASRNPALRKENRKATLIVTVVPSGDITTVRLDDPGLDEPQLNACLKRAAKRMNFPSFDGSPLLVDVPLSFAK